MAFQPSQYSDAASAVETLAPLAIQAGTKIATTAITGKRPRRRAGASGAAVAPPPPASMSTFPSMPLLVGGVMVMGTLALVIFKPKKPAEAA